MSTTSTQKIGDDRVLTVMRTFDAPRDTVWAAWIDFNHATHFDGPPGHPMKSMRSDLRVGGKWRNVMRYEGRELPQGGIYREIKVPEVLSFTFAWETDDGMKRVETLVTVSFEEIAPAKTRLTLQQGVFPTTQTRDGHRAGWHRMIDGFAQFLTQRQ
ncbi:MAG: SRPBCC domain-containing protein [Alphaproteobacteria bacterium]